ncbi:MAG: NeuD/PglB/VioB family sugar acetyltransferase [Candidatus Omnitrophica bacterium]|nr:NeuD/PglB/VioB family sugar acetyltransferase [Candidatus Omnitrophota bacterium]
MKNLKKNSTKKRIVIIGARIDGHAGVILDVLNLLGEYQVIGFIDNTPELQNKTINGIPVIGSTDNLGSMKMPAHYAHVAIGDNVARGELFKKLESRGIALVTIIHPSAIVSPNSKIEEGCFIGACAVVNRGAVVGAASIINTGAIVEHDNKIGFAVHLAPGVKTAGRVRIDDFAFVGLGSTVLPDIHIGSGAMIGAGSTVVKDVTPKTTVFGYAAKKYNKNIYIDTRSDVDAGDKVYVAQPTLPEYHLIESKFREIASSLRLSNFAKYSRELELEVEDQLSVKKALTFPNATTALMLALKALDLTGEVILPSFTFSATGHAVTWNGLTPVFADIEPDTFNIDPKDVEKKITKKTSAILAVHVFGNPANITALEKIAKKHNLKLLFDSAHALGSRYHDLPVGGFGDAECFSLSGTKVITSAEGGIMTSNNKEFMEKISLGRNYGACDDYDCQYMGLNGKMSEFHAAIALESFSLLERFVVQRNKLANLYRERLTTIPGISFQRINEHCVSTYKDFAIIVDKEKFGMDRDSLIKKLNEESIFPKRYFYPLVHTMKAYATIEKRAQGLKNSEFVANNIICLPIFSHMKVDTLEKICYAINRIWIAHKEQ